MATKMRSKGTVLAMSISSVYTAIPLLISIDKSGEAAETYDGRTIDGTAHADRPLTGYVSNPDINAEMFLDQTNSVHLAIKELMRDPTTGGTITSTNFKLTYTDSGPVSEIWAVTGIGLDEKFASNDGVKATLKLMTSGDPS